MHEGSIFRDTAEGRLYHHLKEHKGERCDAWDLTLVIQTSAISTHVSGVNKQLRIRGIREKVKHYQRGLKHFYVLRDLPAVEMTGVQMGMGV